MPLIKSNQYDFVFLGGGCATLSLLVRMLRSGKFNDKKIVLIEKDQKNKNDHTWCFWEKENGFFQDIVYREWDTITFRSEGFTADLPIAPYRYKMIRGIDFYNYCFREIARHPNVEVSNARIDEWSTRGDQLFLQLYYSKFNVHAPVVFNSIYKPAGKPETITLLQHFKGWVIQTASPVFDESKATIMDFRVDQKHGTTFGYVLPFSSNQALVEYTLFTKEILRGEQYDKGLEEYIRDQLGISSYTVLEKEFGVIPMTNEKFPRYRNGWLIGTAGGQTKSSSGYTFQFIQKQSQAILELLLAGKPLKQMPKTPGRFRFYDNVLLDVLYHGRLSGKNVFTRLFQKNKPQQVLRFLDNESSFKEEWKIISSLPTGPFLKSALLQI